MVRVQVQKLGRPWSVRFVFLKLQFEMQKRKKKECLQPL